MQTFLERTPLFYQDQIPMVAYLVIEGEIDLLKNKKTKTLVTCGEVIGVKELLTDTKSKLSAEANANTTICYLDRSTILSIIQEEDSKLSVFFQELASA